MRNNGLIKKWGDWLVCCWLLCICILVANTAFGADWPTEPYDLYEPLSILDTEIFAYNDILSRGKNSYFAADEKNSYFLMLNTVKLSWFMLVSPRNGGQEVRDSHGDIRPGRVFIVRKVTATAKTFDMDLADEECLPSYGNIKTHGCREILRLNAEVVRRGEFTEPDLNVKLTFVSQNGIIKKVAELTFEKTYKRKIKAIHTESPEELLIDTGAKNLCEYIIGKSEYMDQCVKGMSGELDKEVVEERRKMESQGKKPAKR